VAVFEIRADGTALVLIDRLGGQGYVVQRWPTSDGYDSPWGGEGHSRLVAVAEWHEAAAWNASADLFTLDLAEIDRSQSSIRGPTMRRAKVIRRVVSAYAILRKIIEDQPQEVFCALMLDGKHRVSGFVEVSRGTLTSSLVHPREVFGPAIRMGAASIIVAHNHPSGDPEPSTEDIAVTKRLRDAGEILGIQVLDHIIVGHDSFVSLHERGGL